MKLDPYYGVESAATQSIVNGIYRKQEGIKQYQEFINRFVLLPCKSDQQRHLGYLWCGMMGLQPYRKGSPLNWRWRDLLENWTQDFEIRLDELKKLLRHHSYPLPVYFFSDEKDNTERKVELEEAEFDRAFHDFSIVLPQLKADLAELKGIQPNSMKERQQKKDEIKRIEQQIKAIESGNHSVIKPPKQQITASMVKQSANNKTPYIAYPKAIKLLGERLDATPEELAAWIWFGSDDGGLTAYLNANELNPPPQFYYSYCNQECFDYISPLMACWFHIDDINNFQPKDRYITMKALAKRWGKQPNIRNRSF